MKTFRDHQLKIARDTLKMSDAGALIMGGMTKQDARGILKLHHASESAYRREIRKLEGTLDHVDDYNNHPPGWNN
jgi:hypothetical protein